MGHPGKHIVDPETGLCEICDEAAIQEVYNGKRPGKQIFYANNDRRYIHRSRSDEIPDTRDEDVDEVDDEPITTRYVTKRLHPAPTLRSRRVVYEQPIEEPILIRRKVIRRDRTPVPPAEEVIIHRTSPVRPTTFYYVDKEGQMVPQSHSPPPELPRRYIVQNTHREPQRTVRVVRRQIQTPPPPASEIMYSGPRRQINSDTEIIERQQRMRRNDSYQRPISPKYPEMYYIEANPNYNPQTPSVSPTYMSYDKNSPPPKVIYQGDRNRKPNRVEPSERKYINRPEPKVVKRVYKQFPTDNEFISNGNQPRYARKTTQKQYPPMKKYQSSSQLMNGNNGKSESVKKPAIYYIRPTDE